MNYTNPITGKEWDEIQCDCGWRHSSHACDKCRGQRLAQERLYTFLQGIKNIGESIAKIIAFLIIAFVIGAILSAAGFSNYDEYGERIYVEASRF